MQEENAGTCEVQAEWEYDVVVVGGGSTGCCAAAAAARGGAQTALIEYYGFLGGNMTGGAPWLGFHSFEEKRLVVRGIPLEFIERLRAAGGATDFVYDPIAASAVGVNGTLSKMVWAEMMEEAGVEVYLHSLAIAVEKKENRITGVYIRNKQGCQLIRAKVIIDCTDSADVCVLAGAEYEHGRRHDGKVQIASYMLTVGDIEIGQMIDYFDANPDQMRPFKFNDEWMRDLLKQMWTAPVFILGAFPGLIAKAKGEGVEYDRDRLIGVAYPPQKELVLVASRVENVRLHEVGSYSSAELSGMKQTRGIMELLRKYIPGCRNARVVSSGAQIGIRESRHILGDYYLTGEDLLAGRKFEDAVVLGAYHLDIHSPDHKGLESKRPPIYQIPYRSLLVKGLEGLLVAGRGISASHEAMSSTRITPISAAQGEAAGTAAAIAVKNGTTPRGIDVKLLQAQLVRNGAEI